VVDDADHSFHVRASSGRTDAEVVLELVQHPVNRLNK
jgi:hypothetical protein